MNQITLSKMEIRNFKGIKEFTLDINGLTANIYGENGTGKTTLNDTFQWVLFGKDSANRADFSVKPQDKDGNDIHFLETDVTIELLINGKLKTFRKMLAEKWTKKRGESNKEFTGHETSCWVDTVPVKAKEYQAEINALIDETAFKLLTNPFYFCNQLKWEDRRKTLMEICGDVTDADVIVSNKSLNALTDILDGRSINDQRKIIAERIKKLNSDIESIPIKINELSRTLLSEDVNYSVVEERLLEQKTILRKIEKSMLGASQVADKFRKKQQEVFKLETSIGARKKVLDEEAGSGSKRFVDEKTQLENEQYRLENSIYSLKDMIKNTSGEIERVTKGMTDLREKWNEVSSRSFEEPDPSNFICPTCKRALPEDDISQQIYEIRESFNTAKQNELAKINTDGKSLKARKGELEANVTKFGEELMQKDAKLREIAERLAEIDKELKDIQKYAGVVNYDADTEYSSLLARQQAVKAELDKPVEDTTDELLKQKDEVAEQINELNKILNNRDIQIKTQERIDDLKDEERTLASQLSEFEKQKFLIEEFIKAKVNLLEDTINSRFKLVKWKLFKTNINGGIEEICEALVGGVAFSTNLNHAARVNAGLDIINVLSAHYGCTAPIFIDFRESVSRIIETESQVINLIKSEPDKTLRVEVA